MQWLDGFWKRPLFRRLLFPMANHHIHQLWPTPIVWILSCAKFQFHKPEQKKFESSNKAWWFSNCIIFWIVSTNRLISLATICMILRTLVSLFADTDFEISVSFGGISYDGCFASFKFMWSFNRLKIIQQKPMYFTWKWGTQTIWKWIAEEYHTIYTKSKTFFLFFGNLN